MPEYEFSLTRILPYKEDSVLIWKNMGQRKPVFLHILRSVNAFQYFVLFVLEYLKSFHIKEKFHKMGKNGVYN